MSKYLELTPEQQRAYERFIKARDTVKLVGTAKNRTSSHTYPIVTTLTRCTWQVQRPRCLTKPAVDGVQGGQLGMVGS